MPDTESSILVVDDSIEDGRILEENLAQAGHSRRLHFCRSTQEALDILKSSRYDIILTDHHPPTIDIFELLSTLAEAHDSTPVLVLTADGTEKLASEAIKQGAYDYLTKDELKSGSIAHIFETVLERRKLKEEAHRATELLKKLAVQDDLTQIFNRRVFHKRLEEEFLRSQRYHHPLSILMVDIDFFKDINDGLGHPAGDTALMLVADTLQDEVRRVDLVARYGGDEFGIILPETSHHDAMRLARRLRKKIASLYPKLGDRNWPVTASVGVASLGPEVCKYEDLIQLADQALYLAKDSGRNQVCSDVDVHRQKARLRSIS